ncbi:MAG: GntR family transcriptional regulator [Aestuariivita sp.]|nr:GntR family transcriptional regulator [Aestuariivita sp.]
MKTTRKSRWKDIRNQINKRILNQTYRPGDKLPRDEDIANEFDCARSTVQRAMRSLADEGMLQRKRKGGTTVTTDPFTRTTLDIPITRRDIESRGHRYHYHLIHNSQERAPAKIAACFKQTHSEPCLKLESLHLADGRPYVYERRWISLTTVPEIQNVDLSEISANEWLVRNRPFSRCDVQIHASICTEKEAEYMGITANTAVLILERTTWISESPITHVRALHEPGYRLIPNGSMS